MELTGSVFLPVTGAVPGERHLAGLSELARDAAACALEYGDPARAVDSSSTAGEP